MSFLSTVIRFRKVLLIILALFLSLLCFVVYKVFGDPENKKQVFYPMSNEEKGLIHSGDIILRRGYGFFSEAIVKSQKDPNAFSHCAMVIKTHDSLSVLHALSSSVAEFDGVQIQSLQRFLNESLPNSIRIVRFKTTSDTIQMLEAKLSSYARTKKPFDHSFNNADTSEFYCTELFHHSFKQVLGRDIFINAKLNTNAYDLSIFKDTSLFEVILNHSLKR
jgi:hypothetical protein